MILKFPYTCFPEIFNPIRSLYLCIEFHQLSAVQCCSNSDSFVMQMLQKKQCKSKNLYLLNRLFSLYINR